MLPLVLNQEQIRPERVRPLRRAEYEKLVDLGVFNEDERIELLYGTLVSMTPQKPRHAWVLSHLPERFVTALGGRALVRVQLPLALTDDSEPEPDLALVPLGDYRNHHPTEALLVVEVADTTVKKDEGIKARLYAECGVPEYWLVNLAEDVVVTHRRPGPEGYAEITRHQDGELRPSGFPDISLSVADIIGR
jgi:Uma2 family endonuclease